jgi:Zn-dependent protease
MFFIQYLGQDPLAYLIALFVLAFGIVLHNVFQALLANAFGDPSAKQRGFTSTSNPTLHLDSFSWIWLAIFGFAVPTSIPVRIYNRQYAKEAAVWLAGPISMLLWAFVLMLLAGFVTQLVGNDDSFRSVIVGIILGAFNSVSLAAIFIFPIPPLDGARALFAVGNKQIKDFMGNLEQWMSRTPFGFMLIFLVLSFTGLLSAVRSPIISGMLSAIQALGLPVPGI